MQTSKTVLILLSFFFLSFIQKDKDNRIDKYVATVDKNVKAKKLTSKNLRNMSRLGGAVTGYYSDKKLLLIKTTYGGELGYHSFDFYILNDSLVFVKEREEYVQVPADQDKYDKYIKSHTAKNGNVDLTKLPLEKNAYNIYYIDSLTIVDCNLKSFGKPSKVFEDDLARKNKEIVEHYKSHLEELKE